MNLLINAIHSKTGGGVVYLNNILPYLAQEKGLDITLVVNAKYKERLQIPKGVTVREVNPPAGFFGEMLWEQVVLPFMARKWKAEVTFNVANYGPLLAPKPVTLLTTNPEVRFFVQGIKWKVYWFFLMFATIASAMRARLVVSNGNYLPKVYFKGVFSFLRSKVMEAHSGCEKPEFQEKVEKKPFQLVTVGDFYPHKNYATLLKAFPEVLKSFPQVKLLVVGRFVDSDVENEVQNLIRSLHLEKVVVLKGAVPHDEVLNIYRESIVHVNVSHAETFSLTLLEAMMCGVPSLVKNAEFNKEVAGESGAVYVNLDSEDAVHSLSESIKHILSSEDLREHLSKEGMAFVQDFSWQKTAEKIVSGLKKIGSL